MNPLWSLLIACVTTPAPAPVASVPSVVRAPTAPRDARAWYLTARVAEARGDLQDAEAALHWVTLLDGRRPWAWLHRGDFLWRQGRWAEATEAYRSAVALDERCGAAQAALGRALLDRQEPGGEAALRRAVALGEVSAWSRLAQHLSRTERSAALAELLQAPPGPLAPAARLERARLWLELDRPADALPELQELLDDQPHDAIVAELFVEAARRTCRVRTLAERARRHAWLRRDDRFVALALQAAEAAGDVQAEARARTALADERETAAQARLRILAVHRSGGPAAEALAAVMRHHPDDGGLQELTARLALAQGEQALALERWAAIEGRWRGPSREAMARALVEAGEPARAMAVLEEVLPEVPSLSWPLARLEAAHGRLEAALARLTGEEGPAAVRRRGLLHGLAGDLERSEALLRQAARSGLPAAWAEVAAVRERRGLDSTDAWTALVEADPTEVRGWLALAERAEDPQVPLARARRVAPCAPEPWLASAAAKPEHAVRWLEQAREVAPRSVAVLDALAQAYYLAQMIERAIATLTEAQALAPDPARAERLGQLRGAQ